MYIAIHSVVQRGAHSWRMAWCVVGDDGRRGKRNYTTLTGCTGQRDANRRAKEVRAELEATMFASGGQVGGENVRVGEWASGFWGSKRDNGEITQNTYEGYVGALKAFPGICAKEFAELSLADVEADCDSCKRNPNYTRTTVRNKLSILRTMLHDAHREGMSKEDFGDYVKMPKWRDTKPRALTTMERNILMDLMERVTATLRLATLLGLCCGLRVGEVVALKWSDFDHEQRKVHISRAVESGNAKTRVKVKEPKSEAGFRSIPYPETVEDALSEVWEWQSGRYHGAGVRLTEDAYIFSNPDGMPYHQFKIQGVFREACDSVGLDVQFHWLRHTFATELISAGVDIKTVSTLLGHARPSTTLNIYTPVTKDARTRARAIIEGLGKGGGVDGEKGSRPW